MIYGPLKIFRGKSGSDKWILIPCYVLFASLLRQVFLLSPQCVPLYFIGGVTELLFVADKSGTTVTKTEFMDER